MAMVYKVTATDSNKETVNLPYVFPDALYAHSSHLLFIMRSLDEKYLDLVSITVVSQH